MGPTAAGKSAIALWLAGRYPLVVISADSRQVYRRFDVGTAKPSVAERAHVQHRGIDVADPTERCSAFSWAAAASGWITEARAIGRTPLVVGGTGLYVRALYESSFDEPELPPERRAHLGRFLAQLSVPELRRWCAALDPARAHLGRTQLLRALEVALLSGHRLSALHVSRRRAPQHTARYLVVDPGRALGERIAARARSMLWGGWIDEVRELDATVPPEAPAWNSTGYRAVRSLVRGEATKATVLDEVIIETRQYAKRQRTWFRHQLHERDVTRIDPTAPGWKDAVERWWSGEAAE
ncbi:MAG: tRNA (adenosine(37)-N6)-dimethylallyltransferase MiaA [Gemmatimonadota bacterium]|nr:tRNA (adenosine(37)-N6)-dimethylallyltransferase MiaA [Gemmatimonadota bacterium]